MSQRHHRDQSSSEETYAGPVSQLITSPVTPSQPRVRRYKALSKLYIKNPNKDILNFEFRTGGPLLCRLPFWIEFFKPDHPAQIAWDTWLREEVLSILRRNEIEWLAINTQKRTWFWDKIADENQATIIIGATKYDQDHSWHQTCVEIRNLCFARGFDWLNVEIADKKVFCLCNRSVLSLLIS